MSSVFESSSLSDQGKGSSAGYDDRVGYKFYDFLSSFYLKFSFIVSSVSSKSDSSTDGSPLC